MRIIRQTVFSVFLLVAGFLPLLLSAQFETKTIKKGSAIINMGSTSPTVANSLKPYGLVYMMLSDRNVPVYQVINQSKAKDGIDFTHNGKNYSGGTFIIPSEFFRTSVTNMIKAWAAQGVLVDYAASDFTVDNVVTYNFGPKWVMDKTNGGIAISILNAAGIPSSAFSLKDPSELNSCDDIFALPHADPTWAVHRNLFFWNRDNKGNIWAGCNAVSILENIVKDTTIGGTATQLKMNFLSANGMVSYTDHKRAVPPFTHINPTNFLAQYIGKTDSAQLNGQENIYLPKTGGWNAGAKIITYAPSNADVPSLSPGPAVVNIYGRAFNDNTRGYVAYQASHNINGTTPNAIAAQRIFLNFSFSSLREKAKESVSNSVSNVPSEMKAGTTYNNFTGTASGNGGPFTYQWLVSIGGTFSAATTDITSFTAPATDTAVSGVISCIATDACGRKSISSVAIKIVPVITYNANNLTKSVPGDCAVNSLTFNILDDNVNSNAGTQTVTDVSGFSNGTVTYASSGSVTYTSAANFKGSDVGSYTLTNAAGQTSTKTLTFTVGNTSDAPSLTNDTYSAAGDNITVMNVLSNDKSTSSASDATNLYVRSVTKPSKGNVYINTNGTLSYLSSKDTSVAKGSDTFKYLACNTSTKYCSEATVTVNITQNTVTQVSAGGDYKPGIDQAAGAATTLTVTGTIDSYIASNTATTNFGNLTSLILNGGLSTTGYKEALIKFNVSSISTSTTITSANLSMTVVSAVTVGLNSPFPLTIYRANRAWTEGNGGAGSGVTFNTYDGTNTWTTAGARSSGNDFLTTGQTTLAQTGNLTAGQVVGTGGVTSIVQAWVSTPSDNNGFLLVPTNRGSSLDVSLYSKDDATTANRPTLSITYPSTPAVTYSSTAIPTDRKPFAYPDTASTKSNTSKTINVIANDYNYYGTISGRSTTVTAVTTPAHGTAAVSGGQVVYTPTGDFVGVDTLTYTLTDGTNSITTTGTVRITVSRVAPTVVRDDVSTLSGTKVSYKVTSNDTDPQGSMTSPEISTQPKNGTASFNGDSLVYTPASGYVGKDTLIYSRKSSVSGSCETALSDTAIVIITITNQAPVAKNDTVLTYACTPITINVKANDSDPEGTPLTPSLVTSPSKGTVTLNASGNYVYTPNNSVTGTDQFTYRVKDGSADSLVSNTVTVVITISASSNPNSPPTALADSDQTQVNQSISTDVLANDSDPNNDDFTISITAPALLKPTNGTITLLTNGMVKYTPNPGFTGKDTYEYQITDSHPSCSGTSTLSTKALVTITVTATPIQVAGTIWNDVDYSANDSFSNIKTNAETGTNGDAALNVYLTDSTNTIIDNAPVNNDGTYKLFSVPSNTSNLSLLLSTESLSNGSVLSTPSIPSGYVNTSPAVRKFSTSSAAISGYDFGITSSTVTGGGITTTTTGFCLTGTPGTLGSTTDASGHSSIQWQLSTTSGGSGYTNITGATGMTYTPSGSINTTTWYRRKALGTGSAYAYSNIIKVAVNPAPVITITPTALTFASGVSNTIIAGGATTYAWSPATNLSATSGSTVTFKAASNGSSVYTVTGTDDIGCTGTKSITVTVVTTPVATAITGPCAVGKNTTKTYSVNAVNATRYVWTLPNGWTGSSTNSSITATAGTSGGTIYVTPYNGDLAGNTVSYNVSVIDYTKVTLGGIPVTASGNNNSQIKITVTLYDANGNRINCSGGTAAVNFCTTNPGSFTPVVDNNDGTYTTFVTASANTLDICGSVDSIPVTNKTTVTFTGPQGSISAIPPILATETPKIKVTMTEGRAPFTVVYKSAKSNKNDTLTNYTSGTFVNNPLIPSTTLYTLIAIIDANGERRDNNFTRDTASVVVVAPKVIITLKSETPKREPDSTWATVINVKTKNIGDLPLFNSGAVLDLKSVFPNPVTFRLDSVKWSGVNTVVPNRTYDGTQATDLFAALQKTQKRITQFAGYRKNTQAVEENSLSSPDGGVSDYFNRDEADLPAAVLGEDGHSVYLFGSQSSLPLNAEAFITLYLHIKPNGYTEPFVMQAVALGTGKTDGATALTTSISNDNEDVSKHPEVTKQGDPTPTVVNLFPTASIGTSLNAGTPVLQGNGTYNVLMTYKVRNYGNVNLTNVQITNNLLTSIGAPAVFTVTGPLVATGTLVPNQSFNGKTDLNLITSGFVLGYKQEASITYTLNITPNQLSALYNLQTTASGFSPDLNQTVTDLSTDGTNPDPDGNNIPSEKIITQILINRTIPTLVPGPIAIKTGPTTTALSQSFCISAANVPLIPTGLNSGGQGAPYLYQWQSSADNSVFTDIIGAEDSTYTTGTITATTYFRRGTISGNQIKYSNAVTVQIYPRPAKPVITGDTLVVGRGRAVLTSTAASSYAWSTGETLRTVTVVNAGSYSVTVTDVNGCVNTSDAFTVTALDPYKVADIEKILSKPVTLQADGSYTLGFIFRAKNLRSEALDSLKIKDDLTKVFPTGVQFQVTDVKASGQLIANSQFNGNTQIDVLGDVSKLAGSKTDSVEVMLKVTPQGFAGTLSNTATLTAKSPFGTFTVTSNDPSVGNGISVRNPTKFIIPVIDIFIPSGFSPNRDGVNDLFVITRPVTTTISLEIYNRWGNSVYKVPDYKNEWDGRGNQPNRVLGDELPDGTYYYIVLATDRVTGTVRKFSGYVTLKR
jgi:gliding motility-associated-like protein